MTLRYDTHGRPRGLDWTICNDGSNDISIWSTWSRPKPRRRRPDIKNPGSGRGQLQRLPADIESAIITMYQNEMKSAFDISKVYDITPKTVYRVLKRNDIPVRTMSRAMQLSHARRNA